MQQNIKFLMLSAFILMLSTSCNNKENKKYSFELNPEKIVEVVDDVAKWQIKEYPEMNERRPVYKAENDLEWNNGIFFYALSEWTKVKADQNIIEWYEKIASDNFYQPNYANLMYYHADNFAVCMLYANLYEKHGDPEMIYPTLARLEFIANNRSYASLDRTKPERYQRWTWCDALYMAPPVYAMFANISGNDKLRTFMDEEYWATYSYLYDKDEKLFYRDSEYFGLKEKNGEKVFWGRGNAWVTGGLALLIPLLPDDFPNKEKYITLFQELMDRIVSLQDESGYWHSSLLDPTAYPAPETSSTGFFTYSLWWGINYKILDEEKYLPYAEKGWTALVNAVQPDGMLGWVQPVGQDPQHITKDMTETYGAAAFMLAGKEIIKYLNNK